MSERLMDANDHMSRIDAVAVLMELARAAGRTERETDALEMGARRLMCRHFQRARWRSRRASEGRSL